MPLVKKNSRGDGGPPAKKPRTRTYCYYYLDKIGYVDDQHHALYRSLPNHINEAIAHIGRNIVSLLNADGGIIAYGVRRNGVIHGEEISRREQDVLNHTTIDETVKRIIPIVGVDMYRLNYTDVAGVPDCDLRPRNSDARHQDSEVRRQVLEIRVAPGRPYQLYEDQNHEVFQRRKGRMYGPFLPHEIKDITVKQFKQQLRDNGKLMMSQILKRNMPADLKTSASTKQPAKASSSASTKQSENRTTSVSIKRPSKKPQEVIDLTGEERKTGAKSSSSRPALKELNDPVGKTSSTGNGRKTVDSSKEAGKENKCVTRVASKQGVASSGSEVVAEGGKGRVAQDTMKPGEGHKALVNRAIGSVTRSGRLLRAPPPEGKGEHRASSSGGESDQETPLPNLAKVTHVSTKPAVKMIAAAVASAAAKSVVTAKPARSGTKPTSTGAVGKSSLPVARVPPQPSAAEPSKPVPSKQAPAVAKPVPPKPANPVPLKQTPAISKPLVGKPNVKQNASSRHYPSAFLNSGTHNLTTNIKSIATTHSSLPPPPPPPSYSFPYPTASQPHPYWTSGYPGAGAAYNYTSQPQAQGRNAVPLLGGQGQGQGQNVAPPPPHPQLRPSVQYPWHYYGRNY